MSRPASARCYEWRTELEGDTEYRICDRGPQFGERYYAAIDCECGTSLGCGEWRTRLESAKRTARLNLMDHNQQWHRGDRP